MKKLYLIGSLRNNDLRQLGADIRSAGFDVFDDWHAAGEKADDCWMEYERMRGRTYQQALDGFAANHTYHYDLHHLQTADICVLMLPAGKSSHLELGYFLGMGRPGFIYMPNEPERWDVMVKFATGIATSWNELTALLKQVT
jgi:hypothetical protein